MSTVTCVKTQASVVVIMAKFSLQPQLSIAYYLLKIYNKIKSHPLIIKGLF